MKTRIFLTGASGYLGSLLMERLAELPEVESITGIALSTPRAPLPPKVKFRQMDMRSPDLAAVMAGHDVVVHTACIVLWPAKMSVEERDDINFNGVRNVARAAMANKITRFIHTSSMAAYDPDLARGKIGGDRRFSDRPGAIPLLLLERQSQGREGARGDVQRVFHRADFPEADLHHRPPQPGQRQKLPQKRHQLSRTKSPPAIHSRGGRGGRIHPALHTDMPGAFNVVPDDFLRMRDVWKIVGAKFVPTVPLWLASWITGIRWRYFGSPIHPSWVQDMLVDFTGSNAKLKDTGWRPQFSSEQALRSAL